MSILVIAEHDNNNLKGSTLNTVSAASNLSGDVTLLIAGLNIDNVVLEAQSIDGVSKILKCDSETYGNAVAEDLSSLIPGFFEGVVVINNFLCKICCIFLHEQYYLGSIFFQNQV